MGIMQGNQQAEIVIVGGGMVGLVLAVALAQKDFQVSVIESQPPPLTWDATPTARVSAINAVAIRLLTNIGLWSRCNSHAYTALRQLTVWDGVGAGSIQFTAADLGIAELGFIVENRELLKHAWLMLEKSRNVRLIIDTPVALQQQPDGMHIELSDGAYLQTQLCIGADGGQSWVRAQMQAGVQQRPYHQQALITVVQTELAHEYTGRQVFWPSGPLALLPLADPHYCAIVWSVDTQYAQALIAMDNADFECELNNAFGLSLGDIRCLQARQVFPLIMRHAHTYVQPHLALIGDAAHTIHPLAGQGVNLGFFDIACLIDCLCAARQKKQALGGLKALRRYERWRKGDNTEMILAMRFLHDIFASDATLTVQMRSLGLNAVHHLHWLKKCFMRTALGEKADLPELLRFKRMI